MRRLGRQLVVALAALALVGGCGDDEPADDGTSGEIGAVATGANGQQGFDAELQPVNGSGVEGRAILSQLGSTLRVQITASGLVPRREHPQHIHALESGAAGSCPTADDDADGDGTVTLEESLGAYGPEALALEPFPRADAQGKLSYQGTFEIDAALEPLTDRVVVLHGLDRDGGYDPSLPVACGRIR